MRADQHAARRVEAVYRFGIWLPILVPLIVLALTRGAGVVVPGHTWLGKLTQILLGSLLYGGLPYAALAVWATWWIGGRPETEIKHLMFRAPLIMAALFIVVAVATGIVVGHPDTFIALGVLGAIVSVPVGYVYVFCVLLLREELGSRLSSS